MGATSDNTRMPPRCCTLLQPYAAGAALTEQEADDYRAKLDEWITINKTYCPSPTCSAFIPGRLLPDAPAESTEGTPALQTVLTDIVSRVFAMPAARFFRGEPDITQLPGYTTIVSNHIDLTSIQAHAEAGGYTTTHDLTRDMALIVANTKATFNKPGHPIANTADELYERYLVELSAAMDRLISTTSTPNAARLFACPKCHIGICIKCKLVEHGTSACDTTAGDAELAMLETFRLKRCPLCKHAVRKMYGCSHIQCLCGAHWCYYCSKSIHECDGGCEGRDESEDEEGDEEALSDDDSENEENNDDGENARSGSTAREADQNRLLPLDSPSSPELTGTVNLDAGGSRRWGDTDLDFGDEPEDEGYTQVWSCIHSFLRYDSKNDGFDHGDETKMECNRCFAKVAPFKVPVGPTPKVVHVKKRRLHHLRAPTVQPADVHVTSQLEENPNAGGEADHQAWECHLCHLVVCMVCREKYSTGKQALK